MDITPQDATTQPISDDQELAKALAGVLPDEPAAPAVALSGMEFEEIHVPTPTDPAAAPVAPEAPLVPDNTPVVPSFDTPAVPSFPDTSAPASDLEGIKSNAIQELRPLIDHVDLPPEEKFDTYLLLIRSTDDATLIAPAYGAAQGISDEKRKAEALLDIIKEIDYLSKKDQAA